MTARHYGAIRPAPALVWTYAARRRVFLWAPLAVIAGVVFLATAAVPNAAHLITGLALVVVAIVAALDEDGRAPGTTATTRRSTS